MLVECRPDFIGTLDTVAGDASLRQAKQEYGGRVALLGNYSTVILARGTVAEARAEALRCVEEGMEGGGYILGTSDEVPAGAKPENLRAVVEVVVEHGSYD